MMAMTPTTAATSTDPAALAGGGAHIDAPELRVFVMAPFFIFGGITSLNDVIIPKLKDLFTLNYAQALMVQSAFFAAYFLVSIPAALIIKRLGYMRGAVVGLLAMMAGCLLFIPASASATFSVFLFALFVLASGVTVIQVVSNPLISLLGPPATTGSRLTFAQAFNSLGTTVFPYIGSILILGSLAQVDSSKLTGAALDAYRAAETGVVTRTYIGLAIALLVVAAVVWSQRDRLRGERHEGGSVTDGFALLRRPRFALGTACIFLYVGAEVSLGSLIVSYLEQRHVLAMGEQAAGKLIPLYWGGALIGRFVGSAVLRAISPGKVLAFNAAGAIALLLISSNATGGLAAYSLLAVGLMNSIMFPSIFSLASEGLGDRAADGSGVICMAIVGGAIIPPLTGHLADSTGSLSIALALPMICYAAICGYGLYARRPLAIAG
jgi:FHS family L-fucose permease-like MFS transporter